MGWLRTHGKSIAAVVYAAVTALSAALPDGHVSGDEGLQIAIATTTAVTVYVVPDLTAWPWVKTTMTGVLGGLQFATTIIAGGITTAESVNLVLAVFAVVGVGAAPAVTHSVRPTPPARHLSGV